MLSSLIRVPTTSESSSVEDIFSSALGLVFTDDLCNHHGDPGSSVIYKSKRFGDLELRLVEPSGEDERKLFAHYLWNAAVLMAEMIAGVEEEEENDGRDVKIGRGSEWSVEGEEVLELGAGTGLAAIASVLAGARATVLSDYPSPELLANLKANVERNVPVNLRSHTAVQVQGHEWGVLTADFSSSRAHHFTRVLAADCLWMPWQHRNLARSMLQFLSYAEHARVWVIAGFHTGRAKLAPFFDVAIDEGLDVEHIWEQDADGSKREWQAQRDGDREDVTERKRWLVVAVLCRR